jgi:hypothetical protein
MGVLRWIKLVPIPKALHNTRNTFVVAMSSLPPSKRTHQSTRAMSPHPPPKRTHQSTRAMSPPPRPKHTRQNTRAVSSPQPYHKRTRQSTSRVEETNSNDTNHHPATLPQRSFRRTRQLALTPESAANSVPVVKAKAIDADMTTTKLPSRVIDERDDEEEDEPLEDNRPSRMLLAFLIICFATPSTLASHTNLQSNY